MEKDIQSQIKELEERIRQLRSSQLSELQQQLKEAREVVAGIEAEIAKVTGKEPAGDERVRRKRTSSEEVRKRILQALAQAPHGLSQSEIAQVAELNYNTVVLYIKNNPREFKTTVAARSKRYFLR